MPASLSSLFDMLLVVAGLVLVVTGLVMFIRSKTASAASSVEAFGIKLNVTHPSLILVLAGVGLMLAPRLLPGLPGAADEKPAPAVVAETKAPASEAADAVPPAPDKPSIPRTPSSAAPAAADPRPARSTAPAAVAVARPAPPRLAVATTTDTPPAPAVNTPQPMPQPMPQPAPAAAVAPVPKPARPPLVVASLALPSTHGFWSGETQSSYTRRLQASLLQASQDVLRMQTQGLSLSPREFDAWWNEPSGHPRSRELCATSPTPVALLSARVENTQPHASIESANWPDLNVRLYLCSQHRVYRQRRGLSPLNADAWPFSTELNAEIERFLRAYRDDLRS
ncbi:MAG: hypothetical protein AB1720_12245 [Pseudomonadota bacterium]